MLLGYATAVWAFSMVHVLTRAFFARGETTTPLRVSLGIVILNLGLNCVLIWTPLREAGLAWSTAVCAMLQVALLLRLLRRDLGSLVDAEVRRSWLRTVVITVVMAGAVAGVLALLPDAASWTGFFGELLAAVALGAAVTVVGARLIRMPELSWALGRG